jgi:O-antigen ligase
MLAWLPLPVSAAVTAGTAVLLLVLVQPLVGLLLALLVGPFGALENILLGSTLLDSGQLLFLLTAAAWLAWGVVRRQIVLPRTRLDLPLLIFICLAAVSLLNATSMLFGVKELVKWVEVLLVMWIVVDVAGRGREKGNLGQLASIRGLVFMLLLAGLSQAVIGIWQFGLRGDGPEHFEILGGFYRAYGTFEQPNPFGGYMSLGASLAAGVLVGLVMSWFQEAAVLENKGGRGRFHFSAVWSRLRLHFNSYSPAEWLWVMWVSGCTAALVAALIFSWSRGAWLGFAAAAAGLALFFPRKRWAGFLVLLAGGFLFLAGSQFGLIPASVSARVNSFQEDLRFGDVRGVDINDANYAVLERLAHWQAAVDMARDNLWSGVGFGNYEPAYGEYALINWPYPLGHAHNYYLNILAEMGLPGLLAYLFLWAMIFWQSFGLLRRLDWPRRGIALGLLAAWITLSVHHLVDKLYVNNLYIFLGAMLGLQQVLDKSDD